MATGNVPRGFPRILQWLLIALMMIIGLAIGILGAKLAAVGGSWFFALMGLVMVAHGQTLTHGKEISLFSEVTYPLIMMQGLSLLPVGIVNAVVDTLQQ